MLYSSERGSIVDAQIEYKEQRLTIPYYTNTHECWYCKTLTHTNYLPPSKRSKTKRTVDHIIAKDIGGANNIYNKVHCCQLCNSIKNNKTLEEFLKFIMSRPTKKINIQINQIVGIRKLIIYRDKYKDIMSK